MIGFLAIGSSLKTYIVMFNMIALTAHVSLSVLFLLLLRILSTVYMLYVQCLLRPSGLPDPSR